MSNTARYILIVVCIVLSAMFSGAEIAFMQLNPTKLKHEAEEKNSRLRSLRCASATGSIPGLSRS